MTATPDDVSALVDIDVGLPPPSYRAYPVVDHIADKVCAMLETHPRAGGDPIASTRYRDLVDLATFARASEIDGAALSKALRSEAQRRDLTLPDDLPDPAGPDGPAGIRSRRPRRPEPGRPNPMLNPVLAREQPASWELTILTWR